MPNAALQIKVDPVGLSQLYRDAKAVPGKIQVELRRGIKKAAEPVKKGVQADASFSSRIPGAVKVAASFAAKGATVRVFVDQSKAPEAAAINNRGRSGKFRHPVYGTDTWVDQKAVPFFVTGAKRGEPAADKAMLQVMDDIARQLGFH